MYYFIVNPQARNGFGYKVWEKVEKQLKLASVDYHVYLTEHPGQAAEYAEQLTKGCKEPRIIVIVGGDGTVNEVLDGICFGGTITLGYIPAGTESDLARSLKLPRSAKKCLKKILHPKYHKMMDYGVVTYGEDTVKHRRFVVSAGIGMDAAVCHSLMYSKMRQIFNNLHMARACCLIMSLKQLLQAKPTKGYILLDGTKKVEFNYIYFISAQLHPCEGGGFRFAPKADYSDGKLELCVASHSSKIQLFQVFLRAFFRHPVKRNKGIRIYQCREAMIHTDKPMAVHADGESCQYQNHLDIRCIEKKLRIIV